MWWCRVRLICFYVEGLGWTEFDWGWGKGLFGLALGRGLTLHVGTASLELLSVSVAVALGSLFGRIAVARSLYCSHSCLFF